MDPIEVIEGFGVNTTPRQITFATPMQALSIANEGSSELKVKFPNTSYYSVRPYESVDIDAKIPFRQFITKTSSGETTLRAIGTRASPEPKIIPTERVIQKEILVPLQENQSPQIMDPNLALLGLITIGIFASLVLITMIIINKR